jgi:integrase
MKLTADSVEALKLPAGKSEFFAWDGEMSGFGVRLREGGSRNFVFQYQIGKKQRRMSLGRATPESFKTIRGKYGEVVQIGIRERVAQLQARVALGQDPAAEKSENKQKAAETFGSCVDLYLQWRRNDPKKKLRPSTLGEIERHLTRNLKELNGLQIEKVDRRALALELTKFAKSGGPVQANRTATSAHKFFKWCIGEGLIEINPATDLNKNPEAPRDRVLSVAEIAEMWRILPAGDFADIVRLLTLTGQREREIGDLRWSEVDLENATVTLPPERCKNRREHTFPLSEPAVAILKARHEARDPERDLVFGRGKGDRGFSGWSKSKERLDESIAADPDVVPALVKAWKAAGSKGKQPKSFEAWIIHDLRRSFSTGLGDLGVPPHVCEMLLNHQSGTKASVSGTYNRSAYEREGRQAVDLWAATITAAVDGRKSNVTTLKQAG